MAMVKVVTTGDNAAEDDGDGDGDNVGNDTLCWTMKCIAMAGNGGGMNQGMRGMNQGGMNQPWSGPMGNPQGPQMRQQPQQVNIYQFKIYEMFFLYIISTDGIKSKRNVLLT